MLVEIRFRSDTAAAFAAANPVLGRGEPSFEWNTGVHKIGDGTTPYNNLPAQSVDPVLMGNLVAQAQAAAVAAQDAADSAAIAAGGITAATSTAPGVVELADTTETTAGTDATRAVTPAGLAAVLAGYTASVPVATTTTQGKVELATNTEAVTGTDTSRAVTPAGLAAAILASGVSSAPASTSVAGIVELATNAETIAGTDAVRAVTPAALAAAILAAANRVPAGGLAGQILAKTSNTDYAYAWVNPPATGSTFPTGAVGDFLGYDAAGTTVVAKPVPAPAWVDVSSKPAIIAALGAAGADTSAAQQAIGGTTVGRGVFTAASESEAQSALGLADIAGSQIGYRVYDTTAGSFPPRGGEPFVISVGGTWATRPMDASPGDLLFINPAEVP